MKCILTIVIALLYPLVSSAQNKPFYSKQEVIEDLDATRNTLIASHYNLFAYTPKNMMQEAFERAKNSITTDSLSAREVYNVLQYYVSAANIGHTNIEFPVAFYIQYAQSGGSIFPLELAFEDEKVFVRKNWSNNKTLSVGTQILSINDIPIFDILEELAPLVSAERNYFKLAKIEAFSFPRYYWLRFGKVDSFKVRLLQNGHENEAMIKAVPVIDGFERKREEVLNASPKLTFYEKIAYLNTGSFSGDEKKFQQFVDSAFVEIKKHDVDKLIIDFRNNSGGNDSYSNYVIAHIADHPFNWISSFKLKTSQVLKDYVRANQDTTQTYWQEILAHKNGEVYDYHFENNEPKPENVRFKGDVFVLVNRQSHSQSTVAAAQVQDYKFATIVGEETGEYPTLYASIFPYFLPNTNFRLTISKGYMVRVNGSTAQKGVIPDIFIRDHLLDEKDEILNGLLDQLKSN